MKTDPVTNERPQILHFERRRVCLIVKRTCGISTAKVVVLQGSLICLNLVAPS